MGLPRRRSAMWGAGLERCCGWYRMEWTKDARVGGMRSLRRPLSLLNVGRTKDFISNWRTFDRRKARTSISFASVTFSIHRDLAARVMGKWRLLVLAR